MPALNDEVMSRIASLPARDMDSNTRNGLIFGLVGLSVLLLMIFISKKLICKVGDI
jgi:hypothetical protein